MELIDAPAVCTLMGLGGLPSTHPNFISMPGMHGSYAANMGMTETDLLIALGVRFDDRVTGRLAAFAPHAKVIHVDIDPAEIGKNPRRGPADRRRREARSEEAASARSKRPLASCKAKNTIRPRRLVGTDQRVAAASIRSNPKRRPTRSSRST